MNCSYPLSTNHTGSFSFLFAHCSDVHVGYVLVAVGCLGTVSCIAALSHLPSVVVGVAQTLMPPVGTAAAVMLGVAEAPGGFTMLGGVVLVAGVLTIAQATSKREVLVDLNQHASAVAS